MAFFDNVSFFDFIVIGAVFTWVFQLLAIVCKLVQTHALLVTGAATRVRMTAHVWLMSLSSVVIYWHLFVPGP